MWALLAFLDCKSHPGLCWWKNFGVLWENNPCVPPHPNNVKMWPQHRILLADGWNWCLVEIPLLFLHPPSFLCGAEMEEAQGGHCPTLLCLGVASPQALRAFWGPKTCQSCRSIWTAQDGMLGCDPCGSPPTQDIPEF